MTNAFKKQSGRNKLKVFIGILLAIVLIVAIFYNQKPHDTSAVKCNDNRTVYRYDDPAEAFPLATTEISSSLKVSVDLLEKIKSSHQVSLDLGTKSDIEGILDNLDEINKTYTLTLKAYFIQCNLDPCNEQKQMKYLSLIEQLSQKAFSIKSFLNQAASPLSGQDSLVQNKLPAVIAKDPLKIKSAIGNLKHALSSRIITLNGIIKDAANGQSLDSVLVTINGKTTISQNGSYRIEYDLDIKRNFPFVVNYRFEKNGYESRNYSEILSIDTSLIKIHSSNVLLKKT